MNLTTTEQEKITIAARKYAVEKSSAPDKETPDWIIQDFKAGASYYAKEVMPGMMVGFAWWIFEQAFERFTDGEFGCWQGKQDRKLYSTQQLLEKFFEHLKQKQDATR